MSTPDDSAGHLDEIQWERTHGRWEIEQWRLLQKDRYERELDDAMIVLATDDHGRGLIPGPIWLGVDDD